MRVWCERASSCRIDRLQPSLQEQRLVEPDVPSARVARPSGGAPLAMTLLSNMRLGLTAGCLAAMLGCSIGGVLATPTMERDPGRQMLVTRDVDGTLTI